MRIGPDFLRRARTATVVVFIMSGLGIFSVLWAKSGGPIPGVTGHGYQISAQFPNVANLAQASDVEMAGVPIGTVSGLSIHNGHVMVHMVLHRAGPLHRGAQVQILQKTLVGETYVQITDGKGSTLPSGTVLAASADRNYSDLNSLFDSLRAPTRQAASQLLDELNSSTTGQGADLSQILTGLGNVGSQGQTVFNVLAGQTQDLQTLVRDTGTLLAALDEGQGQIGDLATTAQQISSITSAESQSVTSTVNALPPVVTAARNAAASVTALSAALTPVARNLQASAPSLNSALEQLPSTTNSLLAVLPALNGSLDLAPATLQPLPTTAADAGSLLSPLGSVLSNLNPMVSYLAPYNKDIAAFFSNFSAAVNHSDGVGKYGVVELAPNLENVSGGAGIGTHNNPYPAPGQSAKAPTAPPPGSYPHVQPTSP